jgi:hypothetical protein
MINFRFHIVSLTAVLLALGIGLVLGTTFLDDATVQQLRSQLGRLEDDLDAAHERNDRQQERLDRFEEEAIAIDEQAGVRLLEGRLEAVPVLVVSTEGVDERWVDGVLRTLDQADADVVGVWWLTERLALNDDDEIADLSEVLGLNLDDADRLLHNLAVDLSNLLFGSADTGDGPASVPPAGGAGVAAAGATGVEQTAPAEPGLLSRLRATDFVSYQLPEGADGDVVRLPASGLRIVVVDGPDASLGAGRLLVPVLDGLVSERAAPVVAAQPAQPSGDADEPPERRLVGAIRENDQLNQGVSTVDNLDWLSGRLALLLATIDAVPGDPRIGHYGTADGADGLLPPVEGA